MVSHFRDEALITDDYSIFAGARNKIGVILLNRAYFCAAESTPALPLL